jgi:calcineurin-like phosphoesterase family protein
MSTIAIGDIHGNLRALEDLLDFISKEVGAEDTVVFLGDYIARGPDSKGCIERIIAFQSDMKANVVALLGNHEEWLLQTYRDYKRHSWIIGMEAFETIRSYSPSAAKRLGEELEKLGPRLLFNDMALPYEIFFDLVPEGHIAFLNLLKTFYRTVDAVCVHGGLNPDGRPVEEQLSEHLIWGAERFPDLYRGDDLILYGHADDPVLDEKGWPHPRVVARTHGLDTVSTGVLTALRLPDGAIFQSHRFS